MSFKSGSKEENSEPLQGLEEIDVTSYVEDNKELQYKFEEKICQISCHYHISRSKLTRSHTNSRGSKILGWITPEEVFVGEPRTEPTAVVIKLNEGKGAVRFFAGSQDLGIRRTKPDSKDAAVMVFLDANHSFWVIGNASVKHIVSEGNRV